MARICNICEKRPTVGNMVSHANNRVKKWIFPNVHKMRYTKPGNATKVYRGGVCTKCVKAGKVEKVV